MKHRCRLHGDIVDQIDELDPCPYCSARLMEGQHQCDAGHASGGRFCANEAQRIVLVRVCRPDGSLRLTCTLGFYCDEHADILSDLVERTGEEILR